MTKSTIIDYGRSFIHGRAAWNRARFWVESRTRVIDERAGTGEDYYQCGACKSEDTFAEKGLFVEDNYDFTPIFGPSHGVIFRRHARKTDGYRQVCASKDMWEGQEYRIVEGSPVRELPTTEAVRAATHAALPIVARTEIADAGAGLRAIIECPVKTMNVHDEKDMYQVDTGPVAFPDLAEWRGRGVDSMGLAFLAFNAPDCAYFVIEAPTDIAPPGSRPCMMYHYSDIRTLPSANTLYCIGEADG